MKLSRVSLFLEDAQKVRVKSRTHTHSRPQIQSSLLSLKLAVE